ncbi:MAG: nitrilase-related carbon-nitrogen hydrolase [Candidatus Heimdallarchaeaceae archaeon]|jgi:predicted amidohydrolase
MKVGFLQFQPILGDVEENLDKISKIIEDTDSFDLLVIPELANSGYVFADKKELEDVSEEIPSGFFVNKLIELAKEKDGYIVSGICEKKGNLFFNSSVLLGPKGYVAKYRKIHLFDREHLFFEPGDGPFKVYDVRGMKVGLLICWDWIFPEATRILAIQGMDVLAHSVNLVLSFCQNAMITRSIENQIYAVTSNRIGIETNQEFELHFKGNSQVTTPDGKRLVQASTDKEESHIVSIDLEKSRNKWLSDNNHIFKDRRPNMYKLLIEEEEF